MCGNNTFFLRIGNWNHKCWAASPKQASGIGPFPLSESSGLGHFRPRPVHPEAQRRGRRERRVSADRGSRSWGWLEPLRCKAEPDCCRSAPLVPAEAFASARNPCDGRCPVGRGWAALRPAREDALRAVLRGQHPLDDMRKAHEPTPVVPSLRVV
jgi:hypothetical protein